LWHAKQIEAYDFNFVFQIILSYNKDVSVRK
jgi:hypothetical protein